MNSPHDTKHPETVFAEVSRLVDEVWLIALYPVVRVGLAEVPVKLTQLPDEVVCAQILITLWIFLHRQRKCICDVWFSRHDLNLINTVFIYSSFMRNQRQEAY